MTAAYGRVLEIETDGAVFRYPDRSINLRLIRDIYPEPDAADISLYNLSPNTIAGLRAGQPITIRAGYGGNVGTVFAGNIEEVSSRRGIPDTETKLLAVDGSSRYLRYPINTLFSGWRSGQRIIYDGLGWANTPVIFHPECKDKMYKDYSLSGTMSSEIRPLLADIGSTGHIYGGTMYIHPLTIPVFGTVTITSENGLLEQPLPIRDAETGDSGYSVKTLLFHNLKPGGSLDIKSRDVTGKFVIRKITYLVSDSDFVCEMEVY
jgi:hypothetical protein